MLKLPDEPGLIPFGRYSSYYNNGQPSEVFVRSHTDLGDGMFLIEFTNAKSGKSRAWRTAVVREGFIQEYKNGTYADTTTPTWVDLGVVKKARIYGVESFKAFIHNPHDWGALSGWAREIKVPAETMDEATRMMVAIIKGIYRADLPA